MRSLLRSKARASMERACVQHMNKRRYGINPKTGMVERYPSIFALRWMDYI